MKAAAIDLGSNTVKITVAEVSPSGEISALREDAEITRVGEKLDENGFVLPAALERTLAALGRMVAEARGLGAERIACVATAGLRGASNAHLLLERAQRELGLDIEIISGLREAELTFAGPALRFGPGPLAVVDIGGRSTEIVTGAGGRAEARCSLELGAVRLTERFLASDPPAAAELASAAAEVRARLLDAPEVAAGATWVGVSGTVMSLFGWSRSLGTIEEVVASDGAALSREAVARALAELAARPAPDRVRGTVIPPGRADVIVAGALILLEILDLHRATELRVSNTGVRFGLLAELARAG